MIRGFWVSSLTSLVAALITIKVVLHKRGLCNRIAGWGRGKDEWLAGGQTSWPAGGRAGRRVTKCTKKHGTPMKNYGGGWVGCVVSLPCYHPSGLSLCLSLNLSLSLSLNLLFPSTLRHHSMLIWPQYLNGRFTALWATSRPPPSRGRYHINGH